MPGITGLVNRHSECGKERYCSNDICDGRKLKKIGKDEEPSMFYRHGKLVMIHVPKFICNTCGFPPADKDPERLELINKEVQDMYEFIQKIKETNEEEN